MNRPEIKIQDTYGLYIGGQWLPASDGKTFKTYSPADSSFLANVAEATKEDVDQAVKAAWEGFETHSRNQSTGYSVCGRTFPLFCRSDSSR